MAMALGTNIPPGFRFRPSQTELIDELKLNLFGNAPQLGDFVPTLDLAELDPWQIPGVLNMPREDKKWYFSRNLEKLHANGKQFKRKGKSGFWKSTCEEEEIVDGETQECVAKKRILVYHKGRYPGERTEWVVHEFALNNPSPDQSTSFVICMLKKKTTKTEKTKKPKRAKKPQTRKSKRAKKDADIPESLKGEPSGYTVSNLEISVPAEVVWERGHVESNYRSFLQQNFPSLNEGESSYNVTSNGEISHAANSAVNDSVIDSLQPSNSKEGQKDMPTSHGSGEPEASIEELMNCFFDPDENICGPETTDGIFNESSQKTSLEIPTSSEFDEPLESIEELLRKFSTDDDISGKTIDDIFNESCQQISSEMPTAYGIDEPQESFEELWRSFATDDDISGKTIDDIFNELI